VLTDLQNKETSKQDDASMHELPQPFNVDHDNQYVFYVTPGVSCCDVAYRFGFANTETLHEINQLSTC
jgi:hypothetical protein